MNQFTFRSDHYFYSKKWDIKKEKFINLKKKPILLGINSQTEIS